MTNSETKKIMTSTKRSLVRMKGYKTIENAIKAVEKKSPGLLDRARWVPVVVGDGRYVVAFIGWENANLHHLGNVGVLV